MTVDEPVELVPHNPQWLLLFDKERARLLGHTSLSTDHIEHIGSTAVPGLIAKPVIDIMVGVEVLSPDCELREQICGLGYEFMGHAGVAGRYYFRRRDAYHFNLHLVELSGSHWVNNIALRDYLCGDAVARRDYAEVKVRAVESGCVGLLDYSAAKSDFLQRVVGTLSGK